VTVIVTLEDTVYGKVVREYYYPGLKRRFAICRAINKIRDDYSLRMYEVTGIRTVRDN
jgi:hypothetical protein